MGKTTKNIENFKLLKKNKSNVTSNLIKKQYLLFKSINSQYILLLIKNKVYLTGAVDVKIIHGTVNIDGKQLRTNDSTQILSNRGCSNIEVVPLENESNYIEFNKLSYNFSKKTLKAVQSELNPKYNAILLLRKKPSTLRNVMLKKFTEPKASFNKNESTIKDNDAFLKETILQAQLTTSPSVSAFNVNPEWNNLKFKRDSKLVIVGGKNVGKSSYAKYVLNKSINENDEILLIDLDLGQPIFTIPQIISATVINEPILGKSELCQNINSVKSFFFGDTHPTLAPSRYLQCVKELIKYCKKYYKHIAWVINTMGFNKGIGLELTCSLIKLCQPNLGKFFNAFKLFINLFYLFFLVVQIQHESNQFNFSHILTADFVNSFDFKLFIQETTGSSELKYVFHIFQSVSQTSVESIRENNAARNRTTKILVHLADILNVKNEWLTDVTPMA